MNEPKRRGRPTNAERAAQEQIGAMKAEVVNVWAGSAAQAYANRVWAGQSPSLPYGERWYRVKVALEAQGLSMDGVELK